MVVLSLRCEPFFLSLFFFVVVAYFLFFGCSFLQMENNPFDMISCNTDISWGPHYVFDSLFVVSSLPAVNLFNCLLVIFPSIFFSFIHSFFWLHARNGDVEVSTQCQNYINAHTKRFIVLVAISLNNELVLMKRILVI